MFAFLKKLFSSKSEALDSDFTKHQCALLLDEVFDELIKEGVEIQLPCSVCSKSKHWFDLSISKEENDIMLNIHRNTSRKILRAIDVDCSDKICAKTCASLVINFINNN